MNTRVRFVRELSFIFILLCYHFLNAQKSIAQTVTVSGLNGDNNGITEGPLILGQKKIVLFGFEVKVQGAASFSEINFDVNSPDNKNNYFSNFRLYKSTDQIYSSDDLLVKATAAFKKNNINSLSLSDLAETYNEASGKTQSYFLVADYTSNLGAVPGSISFGFSKKQKLSALVFGKKVYNSFDVAGREFTLKSSEITLSSQNLNKNGITPALISTGQKDIVLFGFGLNIKGVSVIDEINIAATKSIESFFSNARLYRSTDNIFSANDILVSKESYKTKEGLQNRGKDKGDNTILTFSDLSQSFNWSPEQYYFLVADGNSEEALNQQSIQFLFSETQSAAALTQDDPEHAVFNNFNIAGPVFKFIRSANWVGASTLNSDWNNPENWSGNYLPGADDAVNIGLQNFVNQPKVSSNVSVGKIILGAASPVVINVDSGFTLSANEIIQSSADTSVVSAFSGKGCIRTNFLQINDHNALVGYHAPRTAKLSSSIAELSVNSLVLLSRSNTNVSNAELEVNGKITVNGSIQTINESSSNASSIIGLAGSIIELSSAQPFILSVEGTNTVRSEGLIRYSSSMSQTVEPFVYKDLELTGGGTKTVTAAFSNVFFLPGSLSIVYPASIAYSQDIKEINIRGDIKGDASLNAGTMPVSVGGNWTNSFRENISSTISYDGSADQGVAPFAYRKVKFSNGGIKKLQGPASIKETLEVAPGTVFNTADQLTLLADSLSFASIKPLLDGADIQGKVAVQSFIKGGTRGYLNLSSPVYDTVSANKQSNAFTYIQLKRFLPLTGNGGPVNGFDEGAIANPSGPTIRLYREQSSPTQAQYTFPLKARDTIGSGKGFFFFFRGNRDNIYNKVNPPLYTPESVLMDYTGYVNRGNINVLLSYTNYKNEGDDGFNLIGNPYAATIDLHKLLAGTPHTKIWVLKLNNTYAVYDLNLQTGTNGASRYIIPSQAFYIQTKKPGILTFTENCKAIDEASSSNRIMSASKNSDALGLAVAGSAMKNAYIKVRITGPSTLVSDEAIIAFNDGSSSKKTDEDAVPFAETQKLISTLAADNSPLEINYLPVIGTESVKLWISGQESSSYSLHIPTNTTNTYSDIFIKDKFLNQVKSLKGGSTYNFTVNKDISATFGAERFELIFKNAGALQNLSAETHNPSDKKVLIYPNPASSNITVKLIDYSGAVAVRIYNSGGILVKNSNFSKGSAINQNVADLHTGTYIIEILDLQDNRILHTEKILID